MIAQLRAAAARCVAAIAPFPARAPHERAFRAYQCKLMVNERARRADCAMPHPEIERE